MSLAPQHLLSLSRLLLGAHVLASLRYAEPSSTVLPAIVLACVADYFDGAVARRSGEETIAGRLLDNCCDAGFLALAFAGFAHAHVWSAALPVSIAQSWERLDWLPLVALAASFGTYLVRWRVASLRGAVPRRSRRGHHAGIGNYALALVGGGAVLPALDPPSYVIGVAFFTVVLLNVVAALDNVKLLLSGRSD